MLGSDAPCAAGRVGAGSTSSIWLCGGTGACAALPWCVLSSPCCGVVPSMERHWAGSCLAALGTVSAWCRCQVGADPLPWSVQWVVWCEMGRAAPLGHGLQRRVRGAGCAVTASFGCCDCARVVAGSGPRGCVELGSLCSLWHSPSLEGAQWCWQRRDGAARLELSGDLLVPLGRTVRAASHRDKARVFGCSVVPRVRLARADGDVCAMEGSAHP